MEAREEAYKDYKKGMKYKDIAEKYGVSLSAVKSWASRYWKNQKDATKKKKSCNQQTEKSQPKKRRGAQPGNKNAVGGPGGTGAPPGNKNALKHGGYSIPYWDTLTDDEREIIENMSCDEELLLIEQIKLLTIRERRLMIAIGQFRDMKGGLYVDGVVRHEKKRVFENETDRKLYKKIRQDKVDEGKVSYLYDEVEITTETRSTITVVERLENELTKVQGKKTDCLRALAQLHKDGGEDPTGADEDPSLTVQVYLPDNGRDGK